MMPSRWSQASIAFTLSLLVTSTVLAAPAPLAKGNSEGQPYVAERLTKLDDVLWSFDFLPDGRVLMTERGGKLRLFDPKTEKSVLVTGTPGVWVKGQGGLLDVRVHPGFDKTKWVYLTYAESLEGGGAHTAMGRGRLEGEKLVGFERLFHADATTETIHFGSRLEFDGNGAVYMTSGERNERKWAQDLSRLTGKVVKLDENGKAFAGNPFLKEQKARPEIYSYGHRNQQGLAYDTKTGELWEAEMGPRGGDELNLVKPGGNYGWPVITYGKEYWGPSIGEGSQRAGMEQPVAHWVPSISPSGMSIYRGKSFPKWDGHAFLACLSGRQVRRVALAQGKAGAQETMLNDLGLRFRSVRGGPDGHLYLSTDDGQFIRVRPQ